MLLGQQLRNSQRSLLGGRDRSLGVRLLHGEEGELAVAALPAQPQHRGNARKVASMCLRSCCLQPPGVQVNFSISAESQQPCLKKWDWFSAGSVCLALPTAFESGCRAGQLAEQEEARWLWLSTFPPQNPFPSQLARRVFVRQIPVGACHRLHAARAEV